MIDDRDLVQRVLLLDDRAAYSSLVRRHQVAIRSYLMRMTHNLELSDDLAQDCFLIGYRSLEQLKDTGRFLPWLYSIAHNQYLMWLRKDKPTSSEVPEVGVSAQSVSSRAEMESLLKTLRPEERSALILCLAHDFTHAEAAELLQMPIGTIKSLILRAKKKVGEAHYE